MCCQDDLYWKAKSISQFEHSPKFKNKSAIQTWKQFYRLSQIPRYLIIGSEIDEFRIIDVKDKILANINQKNNINTTVCIDHFNLYGFKNLPDIFKYDSILFFSYCGFRQKSIGSILASYVDQGGGVVIAAYANCGKGNRLEGRWLEENYSPFSDGATQRVSFLKMGKRLVPNHPILQNINNLSGGAQSSHSDARVSPDAVVISEWDNGRPLISELMTKTSPVIGLNFYPPSDEFDRSSWDASTDGYQLIFNSLHYVSTRFSNNHHYFNNNNSDSESNYIFKDRDNNCNNNNRFSLQTLSVSISQDNLDTTADSFTSSFSSSSSSSDESINDF
ncbi:hypothetical protein CYY_009769 [Polysphondylium violaceum]|uniref:Uncharacterized protein n=1 Tax=Polysphondylium violaceum TaxID=133409 RepID=A0A8J4UVK0_9MYCE|nr:hypothetical protein CYY_009769 [Polysphondylium violaceum]